MTSPIINSPTNPHDRMDEALDLAVGISDVLLNAVRHAWHSRINKLDGKAKQLIDDASLFETMVGSSSATYFYQKKVDCIIDDIIFLAERPVNKFALMPDRTRPEEPWANEMVVQTMEQIVTLQGNMIGAIAELSTKMRY